MNSLIQFGSLPWFLEQKQQEIKLVKTKLSVEKFQRLSQETEALHKDNQFEIDAWRQTMEVITIYRIWSTHIVR